jgi:hypothetical protein
MWLSLVLVNVGGLDIVDKNKKLILAIVWQLMRRYILDMLKKLSRGRWVTQGFMGLFPPLLQQQSLALAPPRIPGRFILRGWLGAVRTPCPTRVFPPRA